MTGYRAILTTIAALFMLCAVAFAQEPPAPAPEKPLLVRHKLSQEGEGGLDVTLYVEEPAGVERIKEYVRSGVPLPQWAGVTDASALYLLRKDERGAWTVEIPLQARITSRWGGTAAQTGRPAKWVLLDFPVSVARGATYEFRLRYDPSRETWQKQNADAGLFADLGDRFSVDTGELRFEIRKDRFGMFENLASRRVWTDRDGKEREEWVPVSGERAYDIRLRDQDGVEYHPVNPPQEVIPEEIGPLTSVIRIRGQLADKDGNLVTEGWVGYTLRIHLYNGKAMTRVFFTLENNGFYGLEADWSVKDNYPKWLYLDSLSLDFKGSFAKEKTLYVDAVRQPLELNGGSGFRLLQQHEVRRIPEDLDNESNNFFYDVTVEGRPVYRGDRSLGVVKIADGKRSMTVGVRHFWQNYPKAISMNDGTFSLELWPEEGYWPNNDVGRKAGTYQFEGGRWKTYEIGYDFSPEDGADPEAFAKMLGKPLFARAPGTWYALTRAIDFFGPMQFPIGNQATSTALRRFNQMHEAYVDVTRAEPQPRSARPQDVQVPPISLVTQREMRGNAFTVALYNTDEYGWFSFGDLMSGDGWCSLHYDWPYGMLLNYLRHEGKREFLDLGEEMVRHRYDIDQYHNKETRHQNWYWFNGFARFDEGWHGDYDRPDWYRSERSPHPNYTWLAGLVLHHALTGDPRSLEAARENAEAYYNYYRLAIGVTEQRVPIRHYQELRRAGMAIQNLLDFYDYTGEKKYFDMAQDIYWNNVSYSEELNGNNGFFDLEARQHIFNIVLLLEPLRKLHMRTGDPEILAMLVRILRRLKDIYLEISGYVKLGRYMPLQLPIWWVAGRPDGTQIPYAYMTTDAYAYAYLNTGDPTYLAFARWLFRDSVVYFQAGENKLVDPHFTSAISFNPWKHPSSESKADAWVLKGHEVYLFTEWLLSREGATKFRFPNDRIGGGAQFFEKDYAKGRRPIEQASEPTHGQKNPDFTPPVVTVKDIESVDGTAKISFVTDEQATVQIEYGADTRKTQFTTRSLSAVTVHEITLTGLEPNLSYFFRIYARDLAENQTVTPFRPLRSVKDVTPPHVVRVSTPDEKRVEVLFSEGVERDAAERKENFSISGGVIISEATLDRSGRRTILTTSPLSPGVAYEISVKNIFDLATPPNALTGSANERPRTFYRDIIADDAGPSFRIVSGDWGQTTTDLDAFAGSTRFAKKDGEIARAEWRIPVPATGYYEVYSWWPRSPLKREVGAIVPYRIRYRGGLNNPIRNQRFMGGQWVLLAVLPFSKEDGAVVQISNDGADGTVLADAIRLVYTEQ